MDSSYADASNKQRNYLKFFICDDDKYAQTQAKMKKQKEYKRKWNKLLYQFNQLLLLIITGFVIVDYKTIQL